jgi:mercuric ion transport protein
MTMEIGIAEDKEPRGIRQAVLSYLSLFTSVGTLLCCALPSLFVLLGLGATVASFLSALPWLVLLSHHKIAVFGISGILIAANFVQTYAMARQSPTECAADDPSACDTTSKLSRVLLWISAFIYAVGFFAAFLLGPIVSRMDK